MPSTVKKKNSSKVWTKHGIKVEGKIYILKLNNPPCHLFVLSGK